jgi:hypothetical protein
MNHPLFTRGLWLMLALALAVVVSALAAPANATFTPINTRVSATSSDFSWIAAGHTITCPTVEFTGRTSLDGRAISGTVFFSANAVKRETCEIEGPFFNSSCTFVHAGNVITIASVSSVSRTSASIDMNLDVGFTLTFRCTGVSFSIVGPQRLPGVMTFRQSDGSVGVTNARTAYTSPLGNGIAVLTATFSVTPRLTVS